jgi:DNA polymerase-3 subunit epsilon/ATP-dependent DNA helicase DinG
MAERVYVALDLETTGLDAKRDAIIEIGAVRIQGDRILDRFVTFINPHRAIPLRVQQITNIRSSDVADAPTLEVVIPELRAFVGNDVAALVAHNAAFDMGFLQAAGVDFHRPVLDTFELATILLPGLSSYSLGELCRTLAITLTDAHRALDDAVATAQLFAHLQERIREMAPATLALLVASAEESDWPPALLFADVLQTQAPTQAPPTATMNLAAVDELQRRPNEANPISVTVDQQQIATFFAADGPLAQAFPGTFEVRRGQVDMAQQVQRALNEGDHLLLEAGTGIGKSMAYLTPAALWSVANGRRVVIATNTITLQEQLLEKDLPLLQHVLQESGHPMPMVALLKGRHHYLCMRRFHAWRRSHRLSPAELSFLAKVLVWLPTTTSGEMEELFLGSATERALWQQVCSNSTSCPPERCDSTDPTGDTAHNTLPVDQVDFFYLARRRAEAAHLLIVNHALLIADLVTGGRLLPAYSHLIVDEAHRLDEVATEQLTYRADWQWIFPLLRRISDEGDLLPAIEQLATRRGQLEIVRVSREVALEIEMLTFQLREFCDRLLLFAEQQREIRPEAGYPQQINLDRARRAQPQWSQIEIEWEQTRSWLAGLVQLVSTLNKQLDKFQWRQDEQGMLLSTPLREIHEQLTELLTQLNAIILQGHGDAQGAITWAELSDSSKQGRKGAEERFVTLLAAPLYVNEILEKDLVLQQRAAIFTGATLRTGSGFTFIRDRLGLWHATALTVDSPFDYEWSTLLCMPTDMPAPDHAYYQAAVERSIVDVAIATGGRTLALFTSYAQLRATADAIRTELDRAGITVLEHGASSRSRLLRDYRALDKAVLLGTRSFWEGVDLPGDELRALLIVKLPFAVPSDPLVAARCTDLENPFADYMLPDAILRFRQGFGRLIRRESDRGTVVLLDSRLWRKEYGQAFLESLPQCTVSRTPLSNLREEIQHWLYEHI